MAEDFFEKMEKHILTMKALQTDQIKDIQKHGIRKPSFKKVYGRELMRSRGE